MDVVSQGLIGGLPGLKALNKSFSLFLEELKGMSYSRPIAPTFLSCRIGYSISPFSQCNNSPTRLDLGNNHLEESMLAPWLCVAMETCTLQSAGAVSWFLAMDQPMFHWWIWIFLFRYHGFHTSASVENHSVFGKPFCCKEQQIKLKVKHWL